jgi:hypothetical protein
MKWWVKRKPREEDYDYTFFTLSPEKFKKIKDELNDVGWYEHLDRTHNIIVLHIPVKKSEKVLEIVKLKEVNIALSDLKVSLSPEDRKKAYTSLYKRVLKSDVEEILNKVIYDEGAAIRDKTEIDSKINDVLERVGEVSEQFNSPGKFLGIAENGDIHMTLEGMCAKMRQFKRTKY